jgi:hypothetical protein
LVGQPFIALFKFLYAYINMDVAQNVSTTSGWLFQTLNFQKTVLIIAIIILIVSLVFIGMQIKQSNSKQVWPPLVPQCPDFWAADGSGNCKPTENAPNIIEDAECNPDGGKDFSVAPYIGARGACAKKEWADQCKTAWEGITYGTVDPCN